MPPHLPRVVPDDRDGRGQVKDDIAPLDGPAHIAGKTDIPFDDLEVETFQRPAVAVDKRPHTPAGFEQGSDEIGPHMARG